MADMPRCEECGDDRLATVIKDGRILCSRCAGIPTVFDKLRSVTELRGFRRMGDFDIDRRKLVDDRICTFIEDDSTKSGTFEMGEK